MLYTPIARGLRRGIIEPQWIQDPTDRRILICMSFSVGSDKVLRRLYIPTIEGGVMSPPLVCEPQVLERLDMNKRDRPDDLMIEILKAQPLSLKAARWLMTSQWARLTLPLIDIAKMPLRKFIASGTVESFELFEQAGHDFSDPILYLTRVLDDHGVGKEIFWLLKRCSNPRLVFVDDPDYAQKYASVLPNPRKGHFGRSAYQIHKSRLAHFAIYKEQVEIDALYAKFSPQHHEYLSRGVAEGFNTLKCPTVEFLNEALKVNFAIFFKAIECDDHEEFALANGFADVLRRDINTLNEDEVRAYLYSPLGYRSERFQKRLLELGCVFNEAEKQYFNRRC
jgi:hypothetical protein